MNNPTEKVYVMVNRKTNVKIESTEKYLVKWMARGFEVVEIKIKVK